MPLSEKWYNIFLKIFFLIIVINSLIGLFYCEPWGILVVGLVILSIQLTFMDWVSVGILIHCSLAYSYDEIWICNSGASPHLSYNLS